MWGAQAHARWEINVSNTVFNDKNIGNVRGADHLIVEKFLQPDTVIQKNVVGGVEAQVMSDILGPSDGALDKANAIAVGDDLRDNQSADHYQNGYGEQECILKTFRFHLPVSPDKKALACRSP